MNKTKGVLSHPGFTDTIQTSSSDVISSLGSALQSCLSDSQRLIDSLHQPARRKDQGQEAIWLAQKLQFESVKMKKQTEVMQRFAEEAPKMREMNLQAGCVVEAVEGMLDRFEDAMEREYGLEIVGVGEVGEGKDGREKRGISREFLLQPEEDLTSPGLSPRGRKELATEGNGSGEIASPVERLQNFVQQSSHTFDDDKENEETEEKKEEIMPSTPTLGDFGISNDDLENLQNASVFYPYGGKNNQTPRSKKKKKKSEDVDDLVNRSIAALRIETPADLAERFQQNSRSTPFSSARKTLDFGLTTPDSSFPPLKEKRRRSGLRSRKDR